MPQVSRRLLGRRKVLVALGSVTTAAAAWSLAPATALARYSARRGKRQRIELPGADRVELLGEELRAGTSLGLGGLGIIEAVLPAHHGAVPVVMRTPAGDRFQVDILRRDPRGPGGVATTAQFDLFIANRGDGSARTDEAQAHATLALAAWIAAREGSAPTLELASFRERERAHPEGVFSLWR